MLRESACAAVEKSYLPYSDAFVDAGDFKQNGTAAGGCTEDELDVLDECDVGEDEIKRLGWQAVDDVVGVVGVFALHGRVHHATAVAVDLHGEGGVGWNIGDICAGDADGVDLATEFNDAGFCFARGDDGLVVTGAKAGGRRLAAGVVGHMGCPGELGGA